MKEALERMSQAKSRMLMGQVFFATLVMGTRILGMHKLPGGQPLKTAATDMKNIYFNPDFIMGLETIELVMFVLAHEVMHIALCHGLRRNGRTAQWVNKQTGEKIDIWNVACDFAINDILFLSKFSLWKNCWHDPKFRGMGAEQIYDILVKESEGGGGRGTKDLIGEDLIPCQDMAPDEQAEVEQHIRRMVSDAVTQARLQGQLPSHIEHLVEGILRPPLPWERLLEEFAGRVVPIETNWSRRNRRFAEVYLPSRRSEAMGELVIIGDTSGSLARTSIYAQLGVEMKYIVEIVNPERIRVVWADDAECSRMEIFEPDDEIVLHPKGGGGTDMRLPLKFVERFDPLCVILATDCYTPWPENRPPFPLITVCINEKKCPHGETIRFR